MKSLLDNVDSPVSTMTSEAPGEATKSGIRLARQGVQPIKDLASFLQLLPEFDGSVAELSEAIAENRALRRTEAEAQNC
jgi:hypothetical protein